LEQYDIKLFDTTKYFQNAIYKLNEEVIPEPFHMRQDQEKQEIKTVKAPVDPTPVIKTTKVKRQDVPGFTVPRVHAPNLDPRFDVYNPSGIVPKEPKVSYLTRLDNEVTDLKARAYRLKMEKKWLEHVADGEILFGKDYKITLDEFIAKEEKKQ
jgi:hypothetical protein